MGWLLTSLEIHRRNCRKILRKHETAPFINLTIHKRDFDSRAHINEYLNLLTLDYSQARWEATPIDRTIYSFIPLVPETPRLGFTFRGSQVLTGHGAFGCHLYRIGKSEDGICEGCQEFDNPEHRILRCPNFLAERTALSRLIDPINLKQVPSLPREAYAAFARSTRTP